MADDGQAAGWPRTTPAPADRPDGPAGRRRASLRAVPAQAVRRGTGGLAAARPRSGASEPGQPVRGACFVLTRRRRHERARCPAAERLRHAGRRRLDVRRRADRHGLRRQLGGHQGHRAEDRRLPRSRSHAGQPAQQRAITEAVSHRRGLAGRGDRPSRGSSTTVAAWSRAEWIEKTMPVWQRLVEPVATHIADAMEGALKFGDGEDRRPCPGWPGWSRCCGRCCAPPARACSGCSSARAWGSWPTEVVGATDIGLPLSEPGHVALLPTNVAAFGEGLEQSSTDVTLYLALRECARQRLFAAAGWLRAQMLTLVEQYARGITIDTSALEEAVGQLDPNNLAELASTLEGGLFEPQKTPRAAGHAGAAGDDARAGRGLGRRGRQPGDGAVDAGGRGAGRDRTPGPGDRRTGRGDLRDAGRPGAAAAADARRGQPVGRGARRPRRRRPRRRLVPSRPGADLGRSRRPARLRRRPKRDAGAAATTTSTPRWPSCWTPSPARIRTGPGGSRRRGCSTAAGTRSRDGPRPPPIKIDCGGATLIIFRIIPTAGRVPARVRI